MQINTNFNTIYVKYFGVWFLLSVLHCVLCESRLHAHVYLCITVTLISALPCNRLHACLPVCVSNRTLHWDSDPSTLLLHSDSQLGYCCLALINITPAALYLHTLLLLPFITRLSFIYPSVTLSSHSCCLSFFFMDSHDDEPNSALCEYNVTPLA